VIGLGEATHSTREFFRLKHRLIRYLVERQEVRLFGLEANFAETLALDRYVRYGEGDPEEALADVYFWTWNTEELLALVEWLRAFNDGREVGDRVRFYGFDAQFTAGPAAALDSYLRTADRLAELGIGDDLASLDDDGRLADDEGTRVARLDAADRVVTTAGERLDIQEAAHVAATDRGTWQLARRHLRTLARTRDHKRARHTDDSGRAIAVRDRAMAANVAWMLDYANTDMDRIVLWAHNAHVSRTEDRATDGTGAPSMGYHLAERYGEEYYALGFDFAGGTFQALADINDGYELQACSLGDPPRGSLTASLAASEDRCCSSISTRRPPTRGSRRSSTKNAGCDRSVRSTTVLTRPENTTIVASSPRPTTASCSSGRRRGQCPYTRSITVVLAVDQHG
jgi:erythromycin esterase